jgi:hypothetical protein
MFVVVNIDSVPITVEVYILTFLQFMSTVNRVTRENLANPERWNRCEEVSKCRSERLAAESQNMNMGAKEFLKGRKALISEM